MGGTLHVGRLNRKLQDQIAAVGRIGSRDLQRNQDIFDQSDVECRSGFQGSQFQRGDRQFLSRATAQRECENPDRDVSRTG